MSEPGLAVFIAARLDGWERAALAASGRYERKATEPEHWRWECESDDEPLDPDLAIASNEEFLGHGDHYQIGLRSLESYPSNLPGMPLVHLALGGCEEVAPEVARHIAINDPAQVLREVTAMRAILAEILAIPHRNVEDCWYSCSQAADPGEKPGSACCDDDRRGNPCDCGRDQKVARMLGMLASIWSDHPDYRESFRP